MYCLKTQNLYVIVVEETNVNFKYTSNGRFQYIHAKHIAFKKKEKILILHNMKANLAFRDL